MNDLLFYESVPAIKQEWANPCLTCPLIATRVVQTTSRTFPVIAGLSDLISFTTRTGTQENVQTNVFRLETHRDLSAWVKNIIYYTYKACIETNKVSARTFLNYFYFLKYECIIVQLFPQKFFFFYLPLSFLFVLMVCLSFLFCQLFIFIYISYYFYIFFIKQPKLYF